MDEVVVSMREIGAWHRSSVTLSNVTDDLSVVLPCADDAPDFYHVGVLPVAEEQYIVRRLKYFTRCRPCVRSCTAAWGASPGRRSVLRSVFIRIRPRVNLIESSACEAFPCSPYHRPGSCRLRPLALMRGAGRCASRPARSGVALGRCGRTDNDAFACGRAGRCTRPRRTAARRGPRDGKAARQLGGTQQGIEGVEAALGIDPSVHENGS